MDDAPDLLRITHEVVDGGRSVRLHMVGEIDMATVPHVEEALASALEDGSDQVVLDLSGVEFMDSSGLNALILARNVLDERSVRLVIAGLSDQVRRLFEISGLTTVFTFAP